MVNGMEINASIDEEDEGRKGEGRKGEGRKGEIKEG